jgi:nucleotide-binding universal stress UspA family protein
MMAHNLENELAARVREVDAYDLKPKLVVEHGESIYQVILEAAREADVDLIIVGAHRPEMKDYLLGTNAGRVVRHASCAVLVARDLP